MKFLEAKKLAAEGENKALGGPAENKTSSRSVSAVTAPSGPQASPQARQLAREQNIDLSTLKGTGAGGVITVGDVSKAIEAKGRGE